ncbi:hypothetical protein ACFX1X_027885 [Malus domestica]
MYRGEVVDFMEALYFRGRGILVVQVLFYAADVIIGILGSVGKATIDPILVDRWGIGLYIALRISRGPNSLPYHHLHVPSKFQDLVVMSKMVVEVLIIIRTTQLLILQVVSVLAGPSLSGWLSSISERFYAILAIFSRWIPMVPEGQPQQVEIATSIAGSSRQSS